jgi:hypothetical protein
MGGNKSRGAAARHVDRFLERRTAVIFGAGKKATKKRAESFGRIKTIITFAAPIRETVAGWNEWKERSE